MIDCPNCGNNYKKELPQCPICKASNPLIASTDDVFQKTPVKARSSSTGIIIGAVVAIVAIIGITVFTLGPNLTTLFTAKTQENLDSNSENVNSGPNENDTVRDVVKDNVQIETEQVIDTKIHNLVESRVFLYANDSKTFLVNIPNQNVSKLEGSIDVVDGKYIHQCSF